MSRISTRFLQAVVVLIGIGAFAFMLLEPHVEGRNVNATVYQIYLNDPFLAYAYLSSVPFFVALHQSFRLIGIIGENKGRSSDSMKALRTIRRCAISFACLVGAAVAYLSVFERGKDDIAGGVAISVGMMSLSALVAAIATVLAKKRQP